MLACWLTLSTPCSSDLNLDIKSRHEGEEKYGFETWFSGHRNGESGINNPGTDDINGELHGNQPRSLNRLELTRRTDYIAAIEWIQQQIESDEKYQSDDTRFWVDVQAI